MRDVLIIPAIDLKGGRCVRLKQGRMSDETVFSNTPEEMAIRWHACGARRLHLVDLDGAIQGRAVNTEVIKRIVAAVPIPVELGGGVRDLMVLEAYLELGLRYVILGTVACKDPEFVRRACRAHPGQIILGIDARDGSVAVEGWTEETRQHPTDLARQFEDAGIAAIIYTDISRDGMRTGCNVAATRDLARSTHIPVIASGGISGLPDVLEILPLQEDGVIGMITGRALYDGSLNLSDAIRACEESQKNDMKSDGDR
ncbi:MAG: 1-(5-phosphoribosyl)-5-[(5-phosphoribosylamino)methylideneamino] imidazole-4-carboxamide isomerase [Thermodesulfobacteriota bacterium]|nr:1-(5-phosphoribosyl)-5-[(5-phosphoribosylamino)methylideneamino] imidazole-4-carboxamide isomerase [Thermodesulfobacteriota bacterium]